MPTSRIAPTFNASALLPGDILLMRGQGAMSDVIAWCGDSPYSHAAIMVSTTDLVEAAIPVAHRVPLSTKLEDPECYAYIDAYRPTDAAGNPLGDGARLALAQAACGLIKQPYPVDELLFLAIYGALRNCLPAEPFLRYLLREAMRELAANPPSGMVCSQLVYEAMKKADLAPMIVVVGETGLPFPAVDWVQLYKQWKAAGGWLPPWRDPIPPVSDAELTAAFADYRQRHGLAASRADPGLGWQVRDPASIDVMPLDLSTSPQIRMLGRLALGMPADAR